MTWYILHFMYRPSYRELRYDMVHSAVHDMADITPRLTHYLNIYFVHSITFGVAAYDVPPPPTARCRAARSRGQTSAVKTGRTYP